MLLTKDLEYSYDGKTTLHFPDINCQPNEQWLLLGQSGSGKTTLLHLLAGLMKPSRGQIHIGEQELGRLTGSRLDDFRGRNIGLVFQKPHFVRALSVVDNLLLAQHLSGLKTDPDRANELLTHLGIDYKSGEKPDALSQGEQQRLAIARALMNHPKVILADEPTSALDDINCRQVVQLLEQEAAREGAALLIVTHDGRLTEEFKNQILLEKAVTRT